MGRPTSINSKFSQLKAHMEHLGPNLRATEYVQSFANAGNNKPSNIAVRKAYLELFKKELPARGYTGANAKNRVTEKQRRKADVVVTPPDLVITDQVRYELIQIRDVGKLVGGFARLRELITFLENWQLTSL